MTRHEIDRLIDERGVVHAGVQCPRGLAELARREYGFVPPQRLTQTCELCYLARAFLRQFHPDVFGPGEVYG